MGLAGRFARSQARAGQFALGFGLPLESAARRLAASVRLFHPVRHPCGRPARQISLLFSRRLASRMTDTSLTLLLTVRPVVGSHQATARFSGIFRASRKPERHFFSPSVRTPKRTPKVLKRVKKVIVR